MNLIYRAPRGKDCPYVIMARQTLYDTALSLKGKGLLTFILSKPDDWQVHVDALSRELKESKNTIAGILNELITLGYCIRQRALRGETGRFGGYDYIFFETLEQREEWDTEHGRLDFQE